MGKKRKRKLAKQAKKARTFIASEKGPLAAALVALGGVISSILASQKLRDGLEDVISSALTRAANALSRVEGDARDVLKKLPKHPVDAAEHALQERLEARH